MHFQSRRGVGQCTWTTHQKLRTAYRLKNASGGLDVREMGYMKSDLDGRTIWFGVMVDEGGRGVYK